jgi:hypothetical protein
MIKMATHDGGLDGRYRLRTLIFVTSRKLPPDRPEASHSSVAARLSASLACSEPRMRGHLAVRRSPTPSPPPSSRSPPPHHLDHLRNHPADRAGLTICRDRERELPA